MPAMISPNWAPGPEDGPTDTKTTSVATPNNRNATSARCTVRTL